ncbi:hypothetical protein AB0M43_33035 [Longispora sp. NPDC051575]|uniref:hypothetical protein n=1 Tax=Longispora sp. NPDC051575 TaxID=3154943 RepID=UPI00342D1EB0
MEIIEMTTAELSMLAGHTRGGSLLASRQGAGFDFGVGVRVVRPLGCNSETSGRAHNRSGAQSLLVQEVEFVNPGASIVTTETMTTETAELIKTSVSAVAAGARETAVAAMARETAVWAQAGEPHLTVESSKGKSHKSNGPIMASAQVQTALIAGVLADGPSSAVKRPGAYVGGTPPRGRETW